VVIWDDAATFTVDPKDIRHRHKITPYAGRTLAGVVHQTWVRGRLAYDRATGLTAPGGSFLQVGG
jgi:allantoinase